MINKLRSIYGYGEDGMTPPYADTTPYKGGLLNRIGEIFMPRPNVNQDTSGPIRPMDEVPRPINTDSDDNDIEGMINRIYTPEHKFSDQYEQLLNNQPVRNKPGIGRRLAAIFAGSPEEQEKFLYHPYYSQMADWNTKINAIKPGLELERYQNTNERTLANQAVGRMNEARRIEETERRNRQTETDRRTAEEGRNSRAKLINDYNYFKQNHPNHELTQDDEGNLIAFNPQDKSVSYITDADGQKVKSSKLSDADKANLNYQNDRRLLEQRHSNRLSEQENQGRITKENIQKREDVKVARDGTGKITSVTTTTYDKDGNVVGTKTENTVKDSPKPPDNVSKVRMLLPDGKTVKMIPLDKVAEAEQRGAKRVK